MILSIEKNIAFLAMTKAASTSVEAALGPYCDIAFYGNSRIKHISAKKFRRFVRPYLTNLGYSDLETCCVFRDPIDWLFSWYCYRSRPQLHGKAESTVGKSFDAFAEAYIALPENAKGIGRPASFVTDRSGNVLVDHIYRYDALDSLMTFLSDRFDTPLTLEHLNKSPKVSADLSTATKTRLTDYFAREYEIYEAARS